MRNTTTAATAIMASVPGAGVAFAAALRHPTAYFWSSAAENFIIIIIAPGLAMQILTWSA
jgi:hypothetical protein